MKSGVFCIRKRSQRRRYYTKIWRFGFGLKIEIGHKCFTFEYIICLIIINIYYVQLKFIVYTRVDDRHGGTQLNSVSEWNTAHPILFFRLLYYFNSKNKIRQYPSPRLYLGVNVVDIVFNFIFYYSGYYYTVTISYKVHNTVYRYITLCIHTGPTDREKTHFARVLIRDTWLKELENNHYFIVTENNALTQLMERLCDPQYYVTRTTNLS